MKLRLTIALSLICMSSFSQDADSTSVESVDSHWKLKATYGLNGTQSSFVNWNAGGRNNISVLGYIDGSANYSKNKIKWSNTLGVALGGLQYIGAGEGEGLQKTDDRLDVSSSFGLKMKEKWYLTFLAGFKTQFMDGFNFPNDSVRVSKWMAPGYLALSLGVEYTPKENFTMFLSPLSSKMTFVQDPTLANAGAFGVDGAVYDETGVLITPGSQFRAQLGAYFKLAYDATLAKNIEMKSKLELFSDYVTEPENIDVNAEVIFNFKVNNWFSASVNWNLMYDHDIIIEDAQGNRGPRTQFKSVIGLGVSYTMKNFTEE